MAHKAGFVNIIGKPNVGKSTLSNQLVGERLSVITSKAQTTRHRILGMVNGDDYQIIFSDTPGILKPAYKLHEHMMKSVQEAVVDGDVFIFVIEPDEDPEDHMEMIQKIKKRKKPVLLCFNKMDKRNAGFSPERVMLWEEVLEPSEIIPISALKGKNIDTLFEHILKYLPENPPYYPKDMLTDKSERFIVSEIIREKILRNYRKEIPYAVQIEVEAFKEEPKIIRISAVIYVERNSQKGILIGPKGEDLKEIGSKAREDIETFFQKKVYLELFVKVDKDWRNNDRELQRFGY